MNNDRELMQQALDALRLCTALPTWPSITPVSEALRARLAQSEQEPVATVYDAYDATGIDWHCKDAPSTGTKLYTAPPQREWQGLTDEEQLEIMKQFGPGQRGLFADAIEDKLKAKNGY